MPAPSYAPCLRCGKGRQVKKSRHDGLCSKCRNTLAVRNVLPHAGHEHSLAAAARIAELAAKAAREEPLFAGPRPR